MTQLIFSEHTLFGERRLYPQNDAAKQLCQLLKVTVIRQEWRMNIIEKLGFEVIIKENEK